MEIFSMVLALLSGVALFLFGMSLMGDGLKQVAGNKLEAFLYKMTNTPLKGVALGTGVTSVIQSSSATTVMVIGFVNSGMMKLRQAIGIIMGANIGTSITGWILCLSYIDGSSGIAKVLSTATISAVVAVIGTVMRMVCKRTSHKQVGNIMLGFAILMTGMQTMSGAVAPLRESKMFIEMLTMFSNPLAGILVGIAFTAVLQSASATVGVLQALSVTGILTFSSAFPIILGIGVGAACPVLISAIGANKNGKRTALVYLLNDTFGMLIWSIAFYTQQCIRTFYLYGKNHDAGIHRTFEYRIPSGDSLHPVPVHPQDRETGLLAGQRQCGRIRRRSRFRSFGRTTSYISSSCHRSVSPRHERYGKKTSEKCKPRFKSSERLSTEQI